MGVPAPLFLGLVGRIRPESEHVMYIDNEVGSLAEPRFAQIRLVMPTPKSDGSVYPVTNIFDFRRATNWNGDTLANLTSAFKAIMNPMLPPQLSVAATAGNIACRWLDDPLSVYGGSDSMDAGGRSGDRLPLYNTVYMNLRTDVRGRNFRGSKHFAPIAESDTTADWLNAGGLTNWSDATSGVDSLRFMETVNSTVWELCVISTTLSDLTARPSVFVGATVTEVVLSPIIGTMKRRKEKHPT